MHDCVILGGGISGLMNAYYLNKAKKSTLIIDKDDDFTNASCGNAGLLSAFNKEPLSHPGIFWDTFKMLLKRKSPLYLASFPDIKTLQWSYEFFKNSNQRRVFKSIDLFEKYGAISKFEYKKINNLLKDSFYYKEDGSLLVFTDKKLYDKKYALFLKQKQNIDFVSKERIEELAPLLNSKNFIGGFVLKRNAHLDPKVFIEAFRAYLKSKGVAFVKDEIIDIELKDKKAKSAISKKGAQYKGSSFVIATGSNINILQKISTDIMMIPTKGYSITFKMDKCLIPKLPIMIGDKFIIVTPRENDIRVTSKLEIGAKNSHIDMSKVNDILESLKSVSNSFEIKSPSYWAGFRPLSPNDMPLLGRDKIYRNIIYSMGLGWLGMTFGPSIGKINANLIINDIENEDSKDILDFSGFYQK